MYMHTWFTYKYIFRFDVSVDYPFAVQIQEGMSKVSGDPFAGCLGEVVAVDDGIKQVTALDEDKY